MAHLTCTLFTLNRKVLGAESGYFCQTVPAGYPQNGDSPKVFGGNRYPWQFCYMSPCIPIVEFMYLPVPSRYPVPTVLTPYEMPNAYPTTMAIVATDLSSPRNSSEIYTSRVLSAGDICLGNHQEMKLPSHVDLFFLLIPFSLLVWSIKTMYVVYYIKKRCCLITVCICLLRSLAGMTDESCVGEYPECNAKQAHTQDVFAYCSSQHQFPTQGCRFVYVRSTR